MTTRPRPRVARFAREAERAAGPASERLNRLYGQQPPVVYFVQRDPLGPVRIGQTTWLVAGVSDIIARSPASVIIRAAVPGGRALEHWFRARHREQRLAGGLYADPGTLIADARRFGDAHATAYQHAPDLAAATVAALRTVDGFYADFERLRRNGLTYAQLAALTGLSDGQVRATVDRMRALGFDLPPVRVYASRRSRVSSPRSRADPQPNT